MKQLLILTILLFIGSFSADAQSDYANDVKSIDNIMEALYGVISGDKGVKRDWERFEYLFTDDAQLVPSRRNEEGKVTHRIMTPGEYVSSSGKYLEENGFHEVEILRKTEQYGSLMHVWSTYESYRSKSDAEPYMRGINSIQLIHDGDRWKILQIYWLGETDDNPLPDTYLPN